LRLLLQHMATKQDVEVIVDAATAEVKAEILTKFAPLSKIVQDHNRKLKAFDEASGIEHKN